MASRLALLSVLTAALALPSLRTLCAQTPPIPCRLAPYSQYRATLPVDVELAGPDGLAAQTDIWHIDESVWVTPGGGTSYVLDPTSLLFIGPTGGGVDSLSFAAIIDILALEGVRQGFAAGYSSCGDTVSVLVSSCVTRGGQGPTTTFVPCGPDCCTRTFLVLCPLPGITLVLPLYEANAQCGPAAEGCERGCDGVMPIP